MASKGLSVQIYNIMQLPSDVFFLFHQIPKIRIPTRLMARISNTDSATTIASAIKNNDN